MEIFDDGPCLSAFSFQRLSSLLAQLSLFVFTLVVPQLCTCSQLSMFSLMAILWPFHITRYGITCCFFEWHQAGKCREKKGGRQEGAHHGRSEAVHSHRRQQESPRRRPKFDLSTHANAYVVEGNEVLTLRRRDCGAKKLFDNTAEHLWRPPLVEEDWGAIDQASCKEVFEEVSRCIGVKRAGQKVAGMGKLARKSVEGNNFFLGKKS